jgi:protein SCO1/2
MNMFKQKSGIAITIAIILLILAGCSEPRNEEDRAADFSLENLEGETVTLADTEGQVRLVYFYFSSCADVCLPTTHLLSKVQEQLKEEGVFGEKAAIFSITFDPARDTQERLKEFSSAYNADPTGWHFLRGEEQYSRDLALKYGVSAVDVGDGQFAHQNVIFLIDADGYRVKYYNANDIELEAADIVKDVKELIN